MRPSNHTKSDFLEASRKDRGMAVWLLHDRVKTVKTQTGVRHPPRCGRYSPACNAAEAVAVNVQQEELTNAEESIQFQWPLHCHHTNQTHVLHWHHQHPKRGGGGKENCGFCCHLAKAKVNGFQQCSRDLEGTLFEFHEYDLSTSPAQLGVGNIAFLYPTAFAIFRCCYSNIYMCFGCWCTFAFSATSSFIQVISPPE